MAVVLWSWSWSADVVVGLVWLVQSFGLDNSDSSYRMNIAFAHEMTRRGHMIVVWWLDIQGHYNNLVYYSQIDNKVALALVFVLVLGQILGMRL